MVLRRTLRPRSVLGIFDSAVEIAISCPAVVALAMLAAVPVALLAVTLVYVAAEGVPLPGGTTALAAACGVATLWRFIPAGAASMLILARLSGKEMGGRQALWGALQRAPFFLAAGSLSLFYWALSLLLFMMPLLLTGGAFMTSPLVADGEGPPWKLVGRGSKTLGKRAGAGGGIALLWIAGVAVLAANLVAMLQVVLML
ncbi:MAG: hypothetical protein ACOC0J_00780, partial [Myxococcota bacterium]